MLKNKVSEAIHVLRSNLERNLLRKTNLIIENLKLNFTHRPNEIHGQAASDLRVVCDSDLP
jgi:hypothetical protein